MANWLKLLLGIVVSAGIFIGVWAWVYDMHPLRDGSRYREQRECEEQSRYQEYPAPCHLRLRAREEATETQEKWLGAGLGGAGAGLFWLLFYFFYLKPRRRGERGGSPPPAG